MSALVIFDSNYGNTQKIAEAIAGELGAKTVRVSDFDRNKLVGVELVVVGSPIIGWRPTEKISGFLDGLEDGRLKGTKAAAFDTRVKSWYSGNASKKIAKKLQKAGAEMVGEPNCFYVKDKEGPLAKGEIEKAVAWAKSLKL
ncbi:MAG: flavodoxin [Candidatus Moranbacteria bacterium]|nr:flavodoxin [Candidatus Moranbacteria bacterium]